MQLTHFPSPHITSIETLDAIRLEDKPMTPEERGIGMLQEATATSYSPDIEFQQFSFPIEDCIRAMIALRNKENLAPDRPGTLGDEFFGLFGNRFRAAKAA